MMLEKSNVRVLAILAVLIGLGGCATSNSDDFVREQAVQHSDIPSIGYALRSLGAGGGGGTGSCPFKCCSAPSINITARAPVYQN